MLPQHLLPSLCAGTWQHPAVAALGAAVQGHLGLELQLQQRLLLVVLRRVVVRLQGRQRLVAAAQQAGCVRSGLMVPEASI